MTVRDRLTVKEVARIYGTTKSKVRPLTVDGTIPFHRIEHYVRADGTPAERYVYLRSIIEADLRRSGELHAERAAS